MTLDRSRILTKVLVGTSLLVAAAVASLSGFFLLRHKAAFEDQYRLRAESLAASLADQSEFALLMNNRPELQRIARGAVAGDGDVAYVVMEDATGQFIADATGPLMQGAHAPERRDERRHEAARWIAAGRAGLKCIEVTRVVAPKAEAGLAGLQGAQPDVLGRIRVALSMKSQDALFQSTLRQVCAIAALILLAACALGYLQIRRLLKPLVELAWAAKLVGKGEYGSARNIEANDDEVGELVHSFQEMADQVADRTRELSEQVVAKQAAIAELAEAQQRMIEMSRRSGMAEIASSVLHNVGNVLNSVNVSATIAAGRMRDSRLNKLSAVAELLNSRADDLQRFVQEDARGQRVLPYLSNLCRHLEKEREQVLQELGQLSNHVDHVKQIVNTQQNYARVSGLKEMVALRDLAEDTVRIVGAGLERHRIALVRDYEEVPDLNLDKHQIMQILLNLLRNAKQAIDELGKEDRVIRLRIRRHGEDRVRVEVKDNGIGLTRENLTRVFAHGFTTKKGGHGFGLHSGALAARQMGGALWVESEGLGQGATFTLELPLDRPAQPQKEEQHETANRP